MLNASRADGQLSAIGCLPMAVPFVLLSAAANEEEAVSHVTPSHGQSASRLLLTVTVCVQVRAAVEFVKLSHPHAQLEPLVSLYARALHATLNGACLRRQAEAALKSPALDAWDACRRFIQRAERSAQRKHTLEGCLIMI